MKIKPTSQPAIWTKENTTEWVDSIIDSYIEDYKKSEEYQRVSFRSLCSEWMWAKRSDVYTHYFHRYPAKLLPYIPIFFLSSSLSAKSSVLDPFGGTGTVAVESIAHFTNPRDCNLIEINPLARLISAAKTTPIDPAVLKRKSVELLSAINKSGSKKITVPEFPGIDFWFREKAKNDLSVIKQSIQNLEADFEIKDFFWVCFSSIIRDMSRADPKVSPPVLLSADKFSGKTKQVVQKIIGKKNSYEAFALFKNAINKNIDRMSKLWNAWQYNGNTAKVIGYDARNLTRSPYLGRGAFDLSNERKLPRNSIGMVITSPPYINAQKYTRTTKFELWWLGLIDPTPEAVGQYDKKLIGTERLAEDEYMEVNCVGNEEADNFIEKIYSADKKKAGIISKYFSDMRASLREIARVLKPGGYCILVVGNNLVLRKPIPNNKILSEIANDEGLITRAVLVDEIRSRGLITKRHDTAGIIADEWVILLQKPIEKH